MEKTLVEAHQIFLQENPGVKLSFSKFAKMRPAETKTTAHNRMQFCLCEYCVRLDMRLASLNKFLSNKDMRHLHLKNRNFANSITLCQKEYGVGFHINCIERKCADCGTSNIKKHLEEVIKEFGQEELSWSVWTNTRSFYRNSSGQLRTTRKWKPISKAGTLTKLIEEVEEDLQMYSLHIFNAEWQQQKYSVLKANLPPNWILTVSDFALNYVCVQQDEPQGAHWSRDQVTIHPVVAFYWSNEKITKETFMFLSTDLTHDAHGVQHFESITIKTLQRRGVHIEKAIHFSDGAGSQYKGRTNFVDISFGIEDLRITRERHYFGSRHGKGECDGEIGVLKSVALLAVRRRLAVIPDAQSLYDFSLAHHTKDSNGEEVKRTYFFV